MKKIHVIGGGTAGWITALLVKTYYSNYEVTVIESSDIGILGAGEGTVPHFIDVLHFLNIPIDQFIKNTDSTIKLGIDFVNWREKNTRYCHLFQSDTSLDFFTQGDSLGMKRLLVSKYISEKKKINDGDFLYHLQNNHKVPFQIFSDNNISQYGFYAFHFDAKLTAEFFKKVALSRGIYLIDSKVSYAKDSLNGEISEICLANGDVINTDFVFDCSGFSRLIMGNHFNIPWVDCSNTLPLDSAISFTLPIENNPKPVTSAIAMDYGWMWKIPTKNRYGCGYVFDSSYTSLDEIKNEIESHYSSQVNFVKQFSFKSGFFEKTLYKNCMAVGLSQSFFEPLEATSIWVSCLNVVDFLESNGIENQDEIFIQDFNNRCVLRNEDVELFLHLHYLSNRSDTKFWKEFKDMHPITQKLKSKIYSLSKTFSESYATGIFRERSWLQVSDGLKLLKVQDFKDKISSLNIPEEVYSTNISNLEKKQKDMSLNCASHEEFLKIFYS